MSQSKIIIVSGIDGSGKTSIINSLQESLKRKNQKSKYTWLRYNHYLTKVVLGFCKYCGFTKYEYFENSRVVYHNFYKSKLVSWAFIWATFFDTLVASIMKVYLPSIFNTNHIIIDRWVFDIMIDLEIDTRMDFSENSFFNKTFKLLLPKRYQYFIILRDYDIVKLQRDESMKDKNFDRRYELYKYHSNAPEVIKIDNNGDFSTTISQLEKEVQT
jgi:thymidylate kinase